ncbi:MAG: hypothetical protein N2322_03880, partial [Terrimicrobiaceae bacterium]|nr:hypothetical protein [Terrimicrobiaceae bacterium]
MSSRPFADRHIGPSEADIAAMLELLGYSSLDQFIDAAVPPEIRCHSPLQLPGPATEEEALADLSAILSRNRLLTSHIGMGYSGTFTPAVIRRNILENPGWYTAYTPYQAEIAQGRLEALLNFQTMVADLTAMDLANASLLDEATAVAEAVTMARGIRPGDCVYAAEDLHPQSLAVLRTRCAPLGIRVITGPAHAPPGAPVFAVVLQYPATDGVIHDLGPLIQRAHDSGALAIVAADLLALALLKPPGELGADIVVGSAQRFGVPLGGGGPHPAFLATRDEYKRRMPGRLVGVSRDAEGRLACRLTLQTREQHIRRDKATSNICTAQVLLAVMASMYAVYHGPEGLRAIARRVHANACRLAEALRRAGEAVHPGPFFDTLRLWTRHQPASAILKRARSLGLNLRQLDEHAIGISLDETTGGLGTLATALGVTLDGIADCPPPAYPPHLARESDILKHPVFRSYDTETELQRYIRRLESRDLPLTHSM